MTKISIIIPTLNSARNIKVCLDRICKQNFPLSDVEVIVVDGFSSDGTDKMVEERIKRNESPRIEFYQLEERNIAIARNLGISKSSGDVIVFLDSDCFPRSRNWLQNLVDMKGKEEIVYGRTIVPGDTFTRRFIRTLDQMGTPDLGPKDIYDCLGKSVFFPTTNVAIKRKVFDRIGLLDETVGSSGEDFDFSLRARSLGLTAKYASLATVIHKHRNSLISLWRWIYNRYKNSAGLLRKYGIFARSNLPFRQIISLPIQTTVITLATTTCLILILFFSFPLFFSIILFLYLTFFVRFVLRAARIMEAFLYPIIYAVNIFMKSFGTLHALLTLIRKSTLS